MIVTSRRFTFSVAGVGSRVHTTCRISNKWQENKTSVDIRTRQPRVEFPTSGRKTKQVLIRTRAGIQRKALHWQWFDLILCSGAGGCSVWSFSCRSVGLEAGTAYRCYIRLAPASCGWSVVGWLSLSLSVSLSLSLSLSLSCQPPLSLSSLSSPCRLFPIFLSLSSAVSFHLLSGRGLGPECSSGSSHLKCGRGSADFVVHVLSVCCADKKGWWVNILTGGSPFICVGFF